MEQEKKDKKDKKDKTKAIIIILSVLLALSVLALAKVVVEKGILADDSVEVSVDDNLITPDGGDTSRPCGDASASSDATSPSDASDGTESATPSDTGTPSGASTPSGNGSAEGAGSTSGSETADIVFSNKNSGDVKPFVMSNMFPGDRKIKDYIVQVSYHDSVTVHFKAELHEGSEKLAEVMRIRVTLSESGETLYDGLISDMDESVEYVLTSQNPTTQDLTYEVRVSLSTAVGNEYQNKSLEADFKWWIEESDEDNLDKEPGKLPGILGKTGDDSHVVLWALIAVIAAGICVVINTSRRKDKKDNYKEKEDKPNV